MTRLPDLRPFLIAIAPVVRHEMRALMRGWKAPAALLTCVGVAAGLVVYHLAQHPPNVTIPDPEALARIGRSLFFWLVVLEAVLVTLLAPLLTVESLSGERRRGTLDALVLTRLSSRDIVWGKLLAAAGYLLLVLLALMPIHATIGTFGGVSPWEVLLANLLLLVQAVCFSAFGLFCSGHHRDQLAAAGLALLGAALLLTPLHWLARALCKDVRVRRLWPAWIGYIFLALTGLGIIISLIMAFCGNEDALTGLWIVYGIIVGFALLLAIICPTVAFSLLLVDDGTVSRFWWAAALLVLVSLCFYTRRFMERAELELRGDEHRHRRRGADGWPVG